MTKMLYVGIDVSKAKFDAATTTDGKTINAKDFSTINTLKKFSINE